MKKIKHKNQTSQFFYLRLLEQLRVHRCYTPDSRFEVSGKLFYLLDMRRFFSLYHNYPKLP